MQPCVSRSTLIPSCLLSAVVCCLLSSCNLDRVAVNATAGLLAQAEPVARSYFDWESAGQASPAGIIQLEGLHLLSPDNEQLTLSLVKTYMAYAYGWVMDAYEVAKQSGDYELAEHHRMRAFNMYSRARDLALRAVSHYDADVRQRLAQDQPAVRAYLKEAFDEDALPSLFWLMMAWTSAANNSPNAEDMSDMASLLAIADWVVSQDPGYEDASALVILGGYEASLPKAVGGQPEKAKAYFERALKLTGRRNHIMLVNYATLFATTTQNRELYLSLLREILEAPDQGSKYRMTNKVARRRAVRALARTDELFYE